MRLGICVLVLVTISTAANHACHAGLKSEFRRFKNREFRPSRGYSGAVRDLTNTRKWTNEYQRFRYRGGIPSRGYTPIVTGAGRVMGIQNPLPFQPPRQHYTHYNPAGFRYYGPRMINPYFYGY